MPLVYIPDHAYAAHATPQRYRPYPTSPSPYDSYPFHDHDHAARKQQLLSEYASSLDDLYPSSRPASLSHRHSAASSYHEHPDRFDRARFEAELRARIYAEERARVEQEVEQRRRAEEQARMYARLERELEMKRVQERKRREEEAERQELERKHHLLQQRRQLLAQQHLQAEQRKRQQALLQARQQRVQQEEARSDFGFEDLLALVLGGRPSSDVPAPSVEEPRSRSASPLGPAPPARPSQRAIAPREEAQDGLQQLLAFAEQIGACETERKTPLATVYHYVPHASALSTSKPAQPSSSPTSSKPPTPPTSPKPFPPSALASLRHLSSRLNLLLSSSTVSKLELQVSLEKLLLEADSLESGGDELVRRERKAFVGRVEAELEKLEGKVVGGAPAVKSNESAPTVSGSSASAPAAPSDASPSDPRSSSPSPPPAPPVEPVAVAAVIAPSASEPSSSSPPLRSPSPLPTSHSAPASPTPSDSVSQVSSVRSSASRRSLKPTVEDWKPEDDEGFEVI